MQALIDFDGWRKWKDFAAQSDTTDGTSKLSTSYSSIAPKSRGAGASPTTATNGKATSSTANGVLSSGKAKDEEKKNKRRSLGFAPPPLPEEVTPPLIGHGNES
jgi:osomolarity two-component system, response regulator SSK1